MTLVFDTETTTFPSPSIPANHPNQARIVQLAWILLDDAFNERACFSSLIRLPSGIRIHEGARNAHGITEEDCAKWGIDANVALQLFFDLRSNCTTLVAHNIKFDHQLMEIEHTLLYGDKYGNAANHYCTMEAMTPLCKLPFAATRRGSFGKTYKWPTLQEAHLHAFGEKFEGAHDALADVRATARIYKWLKNGLGMPIHSCLIVPKIEPVTV